MKLNCTHTLYVYTVQSIRIVRTIQCRSLRSVLNEGQFGSRSQVGFVNNTKKGSISIQLFLPVFVGPDILVELILSYRMYRLFWAESKHFSHNGAIRTTQNLNRKYTNTQIYLFGIQNRKKARQGFISLYIIGRICVSLCLHRWTV